MCTSAAPLIRPHIFIIVIMGRAEHHETANITPPHQDHHQPPHITHNIHYAILLKPTFTTTWLPKKQSASQSVPSIAHAPNSPLHRSTDGLWRATLAISLRTDARGWQLSVGHLITWTLKFLDYVPLQIFTPKRLFRESQSTSGDTGPQTHTSCSGGIQGKTNSAPRQRHHQQSQSQWQFLAAHVVLGVGKSIVFEIQRIQVDGSRDGWVLMFVAIHSLLLGGWDECDDIDRSIDGIFNLYAKLGGEDEFGQCC